MVAIWQRFFPKQFEPKQAINEPLPQDLSDRLKIYREFNLEVQERGGYGNSSAYSSAPRTRRIPRYF